MDLQEQPEPFAMASAPGSTDLRPSTEGQMSDSLGAAPLAPFAPASLTLPPPWTGADMAMEMAVVANRKRRKWKTGDSKRGTKTE